MKDKSKSCRHEVEIEPYEFSTPDWHPVPRFCRKCNATIYMTPSTKPPEKYYTEKEIQSARAEGAREALDLIAENEGWKNSRNYYAERLGLPLKEYEEKKPLSPKEVSDV